MRCIAYQLLVQLLLFNRYVLIVYGSLELKLLQVFETFKVH